MSAQFDEKPMALPVTKTGVYRNEKTGKLEFWFCLYGKKALVGACNMNLPPELKRQWARHTRDQLMLMLTNAAEQAALIRKVEDEALAKRLA